MHCNKCGAELTPNAKFCVSCGSVVEAPAPTPVAPVYAPVEPVAESVYTPVEPVTYAPVEPVAESVYTPEAETPASPEKKEGFKIDVAAVKAQLADTLKPITKLFANKMVRFGVIGAFALLLVLAIVVGIATSGNGFVGVKQEVKIYKDEDTASILVNGKLLKDTIDLPVRLTDEGKPDLDSEGKERYYSVKSSSSMDGKITAIFVYGTSYETFEIKSDWGNYTDTHSYTCGTLYALKGKKLVKVAEDVVGYEISVSGKGIAYTTYNDRDNNYEPVSYTLNLYNVGNKKHTKISSEISSSKSDVELSPDGKSVAYYEADFDINHEEKDYTVEYVTKLYSNKKSQKITDKNVNLLGISNKGKYIYAVRIDTNDDGDRTYTMYCYNNKGEGTKLGKTDNSYYGEMNKDHTQILYHYEGKTYVANKAKSPVRIVSKEVNMVMPVSASRNCENTYPVSNLFNQVYYAEDHVTTLTSEYYEIDAWFVKKNPEKNKKLVNNAQDVFMDESAEYLYFTTKSDDLKCAKISDGDKAAEKAKFIAEDVDGFIVTSDRKLVYFLSDGNLCSVNGKKGGKPKTVCDDDFYTLSMNKNDVLYYMVKDEDDETGDVYATSNGKKGKLVLSDVEYIDTDHFSIVYAETSDAVYVSTGSKKLKNVLKLG